MELKTKRELFDKVFVLAKDKIQHLTIRSLAVNWGESYSLDAEVTIKEIYSLHDDNKMYVGTFQSEKCFNTKEELIQALSK